MERKISNAGHFKAPCRQYDELAQWEDKIVALYIQRVENAVLTYPEPPSELSEIETFRHGLLSHLYLQSTAIAKVPRGQGVPIPRSFDSFDSKLTESTEPGGNPLGVKRRPGSTVSYTKESGEEQDAAIQATKVELDQPLEMPQLIPTKEQIWALVDTNAGR